MKGITRVKCEEYDSCKFNKKGYCIRKIIKLGIADSFWNSYFDCLSYKEKK